MDNPIKTITNTQIAYSTLNSIFVFSYKISKKVKEMLIFKMALISNKFNRIIDSNIRIIDFRYRSYERTLPPLWLPPTARLTCFCTICSSQHINFQTQSVYLRLLTSKTGIKFSDIQHIYQTLTEGKADEAIYMNKKTHLRKNKLF